MISRMRSHGGIKCQNIKSGDLVKVIIGAHRVTARVVQVRPVSRRLILDATTGMNKRRLCIHVNNVVKQ